MQDARLLGGLVDRRRALQRLRCHAVARRRLQGVEDTLNGGRVQSGGVQQCGKRPQPAQRELHLSVRGWFLVVPGRQPPWTSSCRRRRRARRGLSRGAAARKHVFYSPHACTVRQLGPKERKERKRKRAGNL